jgi:hypothetical protein
MATAVDTAVAEAIPSRPAVAVVTVDRAVVAETTAVLVAARRAVVAVPDTDTKTAAVAISVNPASFAAR